jgi:hypothetical protein
MNTIVGKRVCPVYPLFFESLLCLAIMGNQCFGIMAKLVN